MPDTTARILALRAAGTSLVVELAEPVPRVLHWGPTWATCRTPPWRRSP
ncbi:hypothetical protein ACFQ0G_51070 [Streptomyces chiangmaiensis]